jgi:hypothetical protein
MPTSETMTRLLVDPISGPLFVLENLCFETLDIASERHAIDFLLHVNGPPGHARSTTIERRILQSSNYATQFVDRLRRLDVYESVDGDRTNRGSDQPET